MQKKLTLHDFHRESISFLIYIFTFPVHSAEHWEPAPSPERPDRSRPPPGMSYPPVTKGQRDRRPKALPYCSVPLSKARSQKSYRTGRTVLYQELQSSPPGSVPPYCPDRRPETPPSWKRDRPVRNDVLLLWSEARTRSIPSVSR